MLAELLLPLEILTTIIIGLVLGSFATAITHRELIGKSWITSEKMGQGDKTCRSVCPSCDHKLGILDLIPLFSWICLRGRCRHCKISIGITYPVTELMSLLACLIVYMCHGLGVYGLALMAIVPFLIALSLVDIKQMILPDRLIIAIALIGLAFFGYQYISGTISGAELLTHLVSAIGYAGIIFLTGFIMSKILKKEALGMGDVKFFAVAGLWLGPILFADFLFLSGIVGLLLGLLWRFFTKSSVFPFGPALILAFYTLLMIDGSFLLKFTLE